MELKVDKTTKILLGAIALGLFLNASNVFISKAYANDCATAQNVQWLVDDIVGFEVRRAQRNIIECIKFDATCLVHLKNLQQ